MSVASAWAGSGDWRAESGDFHVKLGELWNLDEKLNECRW